MNDKKSECIPECIPECLRCGYQEPEGWEEEKKYLVCPQCAIVLSSLYYHPTENTCRECLLKVGNPRIYRVSDDIVGMFSFDVEGIQEFLSQIHNPISFEIPEEMLQYLLAVNITEPAHYRHVDVSHPGIGVQIKLGPKRETFCLVDGAHRAARLFRENKPFRAYILNWETAREFVWLDQSEELVSCLQFLAGNT